MTLAVRAVARRPPVASFRSGRGAFSWRQPGTEASSPYPSGVQTEGRDLWGRWTSGQRTLPGAPKTPPAWLTRARILRTVDEPAADDTEDKGLAGEVTFKATDPRGLEWKGQKAGTTLEVGDGMVVAIFNVTGIVDRVDDRTLPGCYAQTLQARTPKAIRAHDWARFVGKCNPIAELLPGDSRLPATLADGKPWPKDAGGLVGKVLYNLNTQLGRDAFEDAKFLGIDQEWSIGYKALQASRDRAGVRNIKVLDLYEVSDVLWGAMTWARTLEVGGGSAA